MGFLKTLFGLVIGTNAQITNKEKAQKMLSTYSKEQGDTTGDTTVNEKSRQPAKAEPVRNKGGKAYYPQVSKVVKMPDPVKEAGWTQENDPTFDPVVLDQVFLGIIGFFKKYQRIEIAGNFVINDNDQIVYASLASSLSSGGSVDVDYDSAARRTKRDRELGWRPNGQWHTHPGMGAFWSHTDKDDQFNDVKLCMAFSGQGQRYFMCVSSTHWLIRRYRWDESGVYYTDVSPRMENGSRLSSDSSRNMTYNRSSGTWVGKDTTITGIEDDDADPLGRGYWDLDEEYEAWMQDWMPLNDDAGTYDPLMEDMSHIANKMAHDWKWERKLGWIDREIVRETISMHFPRIGDLTKRANHDDIVETANIVIALHGVGLGKDLLATPSKWDRMLSGEFVSDEQLKVLDASGRADSND